MRTCALKTRTFTWNRQWIYRYLQTGIAQDYCGTLLILKDSYRTSVHQHAWSIHCVRPSANIWGKICYQHHTEPDISIVMSGHLSKTASQSGGETEQKVWVCGIWDSHTKFLLNAASFRLFKSYDKYDLSFQKTKFRAECPKCAWSNSTCLYLWSYMTYSVYNDITAKLHLDLLGHLKN